MRIYCRTAEQAAPPSRRCTTSHLAALFLPLLIGAANLSGAAQSEPPLTEAQFEALAYDAYLYAYPLVIMDVTMRQATNVTNAKTLPMRAPRNQFAHFREYPGADARDVVRFNFDTLYSFAWLDLQREPMVLSLPAMGDRYYLMPMLDQWSDVFAVPGTRTTGNGAGHYAVAAPGWQGKLPVGVELIRAPTPMVWIMGRTQTNGHKDYVSVRKIQDNYRLTPLSQWQNRTWVPPLESPSDAAIDNTTAPLETVNAMSGVELLTLFAELLQTIPPHPGDYPTLHRMRSLGIEVGKPFDTKSLTPADLARINSAATAARTELGTLISRGELGVTVNGWNYATNLGNYGVDYTLRALVALAGLGANLSQDAIYPNAFVDADGNPTSGAHRYTLHFPKGKLPPANAFWSLTMYDTEGFQVANQLNRFAIGDRDALQFNADGSLDIYIQAISPGKTRESNWLPAPKGPFQVMLRIYSPKPEVFRSGLDIPPLRKVQ